MRKQCLLHEVLADTTYGAADHCIIPQTLQDTMNVVATTRPMFNSSTTSKSLSRYLVGNTSCVIHKKTRQGTTIVFYQLFI